jgi:hypothetical protein
MSGAKQEVGRFWPVVAGGRCIGHMISRGLAGIECFDRDNRSLGIFATAAEALSALTPKPAAGAAS